MNFPILVEPYEDQFVASLMGAPNMRFVELTRSQAISALETEIYKRIELGELLSLEIDTAGISEMAGKYRTDPTLRDICDNAYQIRDAEQFNP